MGQDSSTGVHLSLSLELVMWTWLLAHQSEPFPATSTMEPLVVTFGDDFSSSLGILGTGCSLLKSRNP